MSNHLTSLAYKVQLGSLLRKAVMVRLCDWASDDGHGIWASKQTTADELCCSKQSVINTIHQFEDEGLLKKVGERPCRTGFTTEYTLNVRALAALPKVKRWIIEQSKELTGQCGLPVNGMDGGSQSGGPKPSLNRYIGKKKRAGAREIEDDWKPSLGPQTETGKFETTWPPGFKESEVERFIAYHQARGTVSKNWNLQWKTWALGPFCRQALKEWNSERTDDRSGLSPFQRALLKRRGSQGVGGSAPLSPALD